MNSTFCLPSTEEDTGVRLCQPVEGHCYSRAKALARLSSLRCAARPQAILWHQ